MALKEVFYTCICLLVAACASTPNGMDLSSLTCEQHLSVAQNANQFVARNFDQTYGNDQKGAEVQLFLIKEKAPSNLATNCNAAEASFYQHLKTAKEKGCDVSSYPSAPIKEFENKLNTLKSSKK